MGMGGNCIGTHDAPPDRPDKPERLVPKATRPAAVDRAPWLPLLLARVFGSLPRTAIPALHAPLTYSLLAGCRLAGREGPVSQSLAESRKLSREGVAAMERGQQQQAESLLAQAVQVCPADPEARRACRYNFRPFP